MALFTALNRRTVLAGLGLCAPAASALEAGALAPQPAIVFADHTPRLGSIAERMQFYGCPGLSFALFDASTLRATTYGERSAGTPPAIDGRTAFQAASISKAVSAIGMMKLVAAGRIGLDDDVRTRLGGWTLRFAEGVPGQPITLRQLLSHSAGINVESYPGFAPGETLPTLTEILDGAPIARTPRVVVDTAPGAYRYSGGGFELVEKLIEEISAMPFTDYMQRHVLAPAGMTCSSFQPVPSSQMSADLASGHGWTGALRDTPYLVYPQHAAASLWSTPSDLARLFRALMTSAERRGGMFTQALARAMLTEQVPGTAMGLGLGAAGAGDAKIISHAGWTRGYRSYFAALPARGEGIVVMTNGDRGNELAMEIVRGAATLRHWPGLTPRPVERAQWSDAEMSERAGSYTFADAGFSIDLRAMGDHFIATTPRGSAYTFYPTGPATMSAVEDGADGVFSADGALALWGMRATKL